MRYAHAVFFVSVFVLAASWAPNAARADVTADQRAALQAQLDQINKEIGENKQTLSQLQSERSSYERDVAIFDSKIQSAQLGIKARNLTLSQIKSDISQKQEGIRSLDGQLAAGQESLAQILRQTQRIDDMSLAEIALGGSLTALFEEIDDFQAIQKALGSAFDQMTAVRSDLAARKEALEDKRNEEQDLLQLQVLQQNSLKKSQKEKQDLVTATKGQESVYQQIIAKKQKSAAEIESALFELNGANKSASFGDMYQYAKQASALTGVRPAFILGILREESNLGENVGTGNWRDDMHPTRDAPIFEEICARLGLNPDSVPVSKRPSYGWGGAMGPAQFIPSTWVLYEDRIAKVTGQNPPNPWDPRTATFASAILLMDNGADAGTRAAERLAALRYLAGWKNATKPAYAFYGDDVMAFADEYQANIDVLARAAN